MRSKNSNTVCYHVVPYGKFSHEMDTKYFTDITHMALFKDGSAEVELDDGVVIYITKHNDHVIYDGKTYGLEDMRRLYMVARNEADLRALDQLS